jgi:hypothetical protein
LAACLLAAQKEGWTNPWPTLGTTVKKIVAHEHPCLQKKEVVLLPNYKVGPPELSWFITPITMVYGTYNYS